MKTNREKHQEEIVKKGIKSMDKTELECLECGFATYSNEDMILHLAQQQEYRAEECFVKRIKIIKR